MIRHRIDPRAAGALDVAEQVIFGEGLAIVCGGDFPHLPGSGVALGKPRIAAGDWNESR